MLKKVLIATAGTIGIAITNVNVAQASIDNGGFEKGDFTGWQTLGVTSVKTGAFGTAPVEGTYQGLATTGFGSVSDTAIESALGLDAGTLDSISTGNATEGSLIYQTFTIDKKSILELEFNLLTKETTPTFWNDFAFISLVSTHNMADTHSQFVSSFTPFYEETGFQTYSENLDAGTYTLGIGVLDTNDKMVISGILVDNVTVMPVPEPTFILGLFTIPGLGLGLKRQKEQA